MSKKKIFNVCKTRRKNVAMTWIDYKKVYDMVLQSWIKSCLQIYRISDEIIKFIEKTMKTWRVELTAAGKSLAEAIIQRGIFQGEYIRNSDDTTQAHTQEMHRRIQS